MSRCPNCNAELTSRPCAGCGWPESTEPTEAERRAVRRALERTASPERASGGCGQSCVLILALAATLGTVGFFKVGQAARWTSDGPAMLFVYLGVAGCGLAALASWASLLGAWLHPYLPRWVRFFVDDD